MESLLLLVKEKQRSEVEIMANENGIEKPSPFEMLMEYEDNWDVSLEFC